jgi:hypothetical protein
VGLSILREKQVALGVLVWQREVSLDREAQLVVVEVCVKCHVYFGSVDFELDLVWLPLVHMDVIFGKDWMLSFGVNINFLTKSITFSKKVDEVGEKLLTAEQVKKSLDGKACVFMMFASLKESRENGVSDLPVVQEFPDVFPADFTELQPDREVEFAIDLVPGTSIRCSHWNWVS